MDYVIASEVPGRLRVRLVGPVPADDLDALYRVLGACPAVERANVYPRIGSIAVRYRAADGARQRVLDHLDAIDAEAIAEARSSCGLELAPRTQSLLMDIAVLVGSYFARRWFLPKPVAALVTAWRYRGFLAAAVRSLGRARLDVPVLDAAAIGMSFVKRDPRTAGETMLLLNLGETLEEYTRSRSEGALVNALLDLPETAQLVEGDQEVQVAASDLKPGDCIAVRTGMPVCVDGEVVRGTAMVNQAALTGEPLAVERGVGDNVFSGTAVEDGEIIVRVTADAGETKLRSIVALVEQAESFKSETQSRMEQLADRIVPWNFLLAGAVALTTRSLVKTSAALMVDYSCALKLTGSIAVLAAMSQSAQAGFTVKGSKHFEAMAAADTIVFDKTGTLTEATPNVACVLALDGWNRREVLRLAACLEEHFPHPVARAVVRAAAEKNLRHRERHADVEYLVAHGIASSLDGKRVVIGSEHFVVEDEGVSLTEEQKRRVADETEGLSPLYLAVDGELIGVIGIEDPLKAGVREAIADLRMLGFKRVVMLTGDGERTAARIADAAGVTEYRANLLPEDKYAFVERLKAEGSKVVMVGDGVNDAPALSLADVGIAMGQGTADAERGADRAPERIVQGGHRHQLGAAGGGHRRPHHAADLVAAAQRVHGGAQREERRDVPRLASGRRRRCERLLEGIADRREAVQRGLVREQVEQQGALGSREVEVVEPGKLRVPPAAHCGGARRVPVEEAGQPEVDERHRSLGVDQQVRRPHVAVRHAAALQVRERVDDLAADGGDRRLVERPPLPEQQAVEGGAGHEALRHEAAPAVARVVALAHDAEPAGDGGVRAQRQRLRLVPEGVAVEGPLLGFDQLEGRAAGLAACARGAKARAEPALAQHGVEPPCAERAADEPAVAGRGGEAR